MKKDFLPSLNLKIANIFFNIAVVIWTLAYGLIALPLVIFLPKNLLIEVRKPWIAFILFLLRVLFSISYEVEGRENLDGLGNFIIASKHHSPLDVLLLSQILKKPAFIIKKSLLYTPIFGFYMIATGMISVDTSSASSAFSRLRKMIKKAKHLVADGRTIVIYPEGSRTKVGQKISYKGGIFILHKELGLPVVPVALNAGSAWPVGYFDDKKPAKVIVKILKPFVCAHDKKQFLGLLQDAIEGESNKILYQSQDDCVIGEDKKSLAG